MLNIFWQIDKQKESCKCYIRNQSNDVQAKLYIHLKLHLSDWLLQIDCVTKLDLKRIKPTDALYLHIWLYDNHFFHA